MFETDHSWSIQWVNQAAAEKLERKKQQFESAQITKFFELSLDSLKKAEEISIPTTILQVDSIYQYSSTESEPFILRIQKIFEPNDKAGFLIEVMPSNNTAASEESLRSLGLILGKLAHDFSNPAAVVRMQSDTLRLFASKSDTLTSVDLLKRLDTMSQSLKSMEENLLELKSLARDLTELDIQQLLEKLARE